MRKKEPEPEPPPLTRERLDLVHRYMSEAGEGRIERPRSEGNPEAENRSSDLDVNPVADSTEPPTPRAEPPASKAESPVLRAADAGTPARPVSIDQLPEGRGLAHRELGTTLLGEQGNASRRGGGKEHMDIGVYVRVLRQHARLLGLGMLVGFALALYTAFNIHLLPPGLTWKLKPTYQVSSVVLVTQPGFPVGRANIIQNGAPTAAAGALLSQFADPSRYDYLAGLYAQLATSDPIVKPVLGANGFRQNGLLFLDGGKTVGNYVATQLSDAAGDATLPFIRLDATAQSAREALEIGQRATSSLTNYVTEAEKDQNITGDQRVELSVVSAPDLATRVKGRKLIIPLAVFLLCTFGAAVIVLIAENVRRERDADLGGEGSVVVESPIQQSTVKFPSVPPAEDTLEPRSRSRQRGP